MSGICVEKLKAESKTQGKAEASQDSIIRVLKARQFELSNDLCEKIRAIQDVEKLQELTDISVTAKSVEEFASKL